MLPLKFWNPENFQRGHFVSSNVTSPSLGTSSNTEWLEFILFYCTDSYVGSFLKKKHHQKSLTVYWFAQQQYVLVGDDECSDSFLASLF